MVSIDVFNKIMLIITIHYMDSVHIMFPFYVVYAWTVIIYYTGIYLGHSHLYINMQMGCMTYAHFL